MDTRGGAASPEPPDGRDGTRRGGLGGDDLIASLHALARADRSGTARVAFADRVANAAAAGFAAIGTSAADVLARRGGGLPDHAAAAVLRDHGIAIGEIDACPLWTHDEAPDADHRALLDAVFSTAEGLGPVHHVIVPLGAGGGPFPDPERLAPRLHDLARRAAEAGTVLACEFFPWGPVPDAASAWAYAAAADHPAAGVAVDFWHQLTGTGGEAALRSVPRGRVHAVHLTDGAPDLAEPDPLRRTMTQRRLPGEGTLAVEETVRLLDALGVDVPYTVEVVSLPHRSLPPAEFAAVLYDATTRLLSRARA